MKKILLFIVLLGMGIGLYGCDTDNGEHIVGVVAISNRPDWEVQKKYFEEEVGPALNMKFIFSEVVGDDDALLTFMENAYAQGAKGIISLYTSGIESGVRKAEELDMYIIHIASRTPQDIAHISSNLGSVGASTTGIYNSYKTAINSVLKEGENSSLVMFTGAAVGQLAASHFYSAQALLEVMRDEYDLTYDKSIEDLINNNTPGEVVTGNDDVKIYLIPGLDPNAALQTANAPLQSGDYDIFAAVFSYATFTTAIDEVEKEHGRDVKIFGTTSIEPQTATGFNTKDSLGNPILNAAILNPLNIQNGVAAAILYNAITGHADKMRKDGKAMQFWVDSWAALDGETYESISLLDISKDTYIINEEMIKEFLVENNEDVTYRDFEELLIELADIDSIIEDIMG